MAGAHSIHPVYGRSNDMGTFRKVTAVIVAWLLSPALHLRSTAESGIQ